MSSDLKELKGLICRKRISKIKKKYESAEKRVYRKLLDCNKNKNEEYLTKCVFIEFKKRYFSDFCKRVDDLVTSYTVGIEPAMREYVFAKRRDRTFEVLLLIKNILDRNCIRWAIMNDYIKCREECICPESICIVVSKEHINAACNIFNVIGEKRGENIYIVNGVEVHLSFGYAIENRSYNLKEYDIGYCNLDSENIPVLVEPRNS
ncbi:MAG: hypothetical protein E6583_00535 [Clostridium sp.]|nr:hypothetical protein [Clostridium sp.]